MEIEGNLCDAAEENMIKLVESLVSVELPDDNDDLLNIVGTVQRHNHTKSCLKNKGKCRYGFPKLPSEKTILAKPLEEPDLKKRKEKIEAAKSTLEKAMELLNNPDLDENMTLDDFVEKIGVTKEQYMDHISITEKGRTIIMKRRVKERFVNNYNKEMITAWNANMDIQLTLDPFAVISYIVNYVNKDESGLTKFMKEALTQVASSDAKEKLRALAKAYLTHRQIGASEAVYRINPGMKLKDSNIACTFVASGFPENRSAFYRKVQDQEDEKLHEIPINYESEDNEDDEEVDEVPSLNNRQVEIEGRMGKYQKATSVVDRYGARPKYLKKMSLAQFATSYTYQAKPPKTAVFDDDGVSELKSVQTIFNHSILLPRHIFLGEDFAYMRLRRYPTVMRFHTSKNKDGHEKYYSEMLLFSHWTNETNELPTDEVLCMEEYLKRKEEIDENRQVIFPGEPTMDYFDNEDLELLRPTHLLETLDGQGDQENNEDLVEGVIDDPDFETFGYLGNLAHGGKEQFEDCKYRKISLPSETEMEQTTRQLVPEQMNVVRKVISSCKDIVKAEEYPHLKRDPLRLLVLGGAGVGKSQTIKVMAMQSEKILRTQKSNPDKPRVLLTAFTGKASSLIGKLKKMTHFLYQNVYFLFSGGTTLHSSFKLGRFGKHNVTYKGLTDKPLAALREHLSELKLIIVDEISLVSADTIYTIHMRLKEVFNTLVTDRFANLNVILVGDLLQLPPVLGTFCFNTPKNLKFQANKDTLDLWNSFEPMILKHNHRQGDEKEWAEALNEFRIGVVSEKGKALLKERQTTQEFLEEDTMHIFYLNRDVKDLNEKMLNSIQSKLYTIEAVQVYPQGCKPKTDPKKGTIGTTQFLEKLQIKVGARVTMIHNVNTIDDLCNGTYGEVIAIEAQGDKVQCIVVKFDDDISGYAQRQKYHQISDKYKDQNGTPIFRYRHEHDFVSTKGYGRTVKAELLQFPLSLAYGQTAHRMQGQTVKAESKLVIHWTNEMKKGMAYVMLGRSSRLQDIYIRGELDLTQIFCDEDALEESQKLEKIFDQKEVEMMESRSKKWKISYLNVRSLIAHQEDVQKDNFLIDSDILGLGETHLKSEETLYLDGFQGSFANFGKGKGVAGFSKMGLIAQPEIMSSISASAILLKTSYFNIIFLYLSRDYNKQSVFHLLDNWIQLGTPTAVMGDINEDALENSMFQNFMRSKEFYQMVDKPTRTSGKLLDHIYVNDALDEIGFTTQVDSCYYSDHDIVTLYVSK